MWEALHLLQLKVDVESLIAEYAWEKGRALQGTETTHFLAGRHVTRHVVDDYNLHLHRYHRPGQRLVHDLA